jgi:hypothetical protein
MNLSLSTFLIFFLVVDIALLYAIVWRNTYHTLPSISYNQRQRVQRLLRLLIIAPVFILLIILTLIIWVWKTSPYVRLIHALLILSLWLPVTLTIFETILTFRTNHTVPISPVAGLLMAGIPIVGLTSINHFKSLFYSISLGYPFFIALFGLGAFYFFLFEINKKLSQKLEDQEAILQDVQ